MNQSKHPTIDHYLDKVRLHNELYTAEILGREIIIYPNVMSPKYDRSSQIFLSMMQSQKDKTLLDIGCGTGNITLSLIDIAGYVTVIDHPTVVSALLERCGGGRTIVGYSGDFLSRYIGPTFDKILAYSVVHYLAGEDEVLAFLRKAYGLLRPSGKMLVGDIPNADRKRRFEESQFGAAFAKAWKARANGSNEFFDAINADENRVEFDDGMIRRLMKGLGLRSKDYKVLPQPSTMPFGYTREDILITKPG